MRRIARAIAVIGSVALALTGTAQRFFFENISVQQGLPASKVYAVAQDPSGTVWIGTEAGLSRYDGINLQHLGPTEGTAPGGARALHVDRDGHVWAGHLEGGITWTNGSRFRHYEVAPGMDSDILGITETTQGEIVIATAGHGAWVFTKPGRDAQALEARRVPGDLGERLLAAVRLPDGRVALVEDQGRVKAMGHAGIQPLELPGFDGVYRPTTLHVDARQGLWLGTQGGGAFHYPQGAHEPVRYDHTKGLRGATVYCFGEDGEGRIWLGTLDSGAGVVDNGSVRMFDKSNGLHGLFIRCFVRDREGNLLIGTNDAGLDIFKGERFQTFDDSDGLNDPQVWAVLEDRLGRIWFGTNAGIVVLSDQGATETINAQQGRLYNNAIRCMREDDKGIIWIGTETGGLQRYDPRMGKATWDMELSATMAYGKITALETGQTGELWIGGLNGLRRYLPGSGTVPTVYTEEDGLAHNNVTAIYRDTQGTIWVGSTVKGVTRVDNGQARPVDLGRSFTATCFVQDRDGRLWVGTDGQGILVLRDGKVDQTFTTGEGLLSNTIKALGIDAKGHVWIGTNKGLNKWRPKRGGFVAFTERAGFTGIEVKPNAAWATRKGGIWFGTAHGASYVRSEAGVDNNVPPLVAIRGWKVNLEDREVEDHVSLPHTDRSIRIVYGSVALSDPGAVRYAYMLDGLDTDWQPITSATDAYYPALPPGRYSFKVKAMDRTGEWSDPPAVLSFSILPPWYRSWWFYTGLALFLGIALFSYIKVREQQLRLRNLVLERKVQERTAEVVAQSREIAGQKEQIEDLLLNILPKEISEELKVKGKATARLHEEVTVLFTDMKGFTSVAERMTPEELVGELDDCFIRFDEIIGRYGIEKIKTIGDSYMCAAGVPTKDPSHAFKCVMAALEVRNLMERWRQEREASGSTPWRLRLGVHSGPVVAGVVGRRKFAYDIWGDTVNTASRMESSGEVGEVNISGATFALVKDRFECEYRGRVEAKNKGAIDMYFVRRIKPEWAADPEGQRPNGKFLRELGVPSAAEQFA
jgi:ligand-binding sensor domain-containing protein/class 3 adenylate cyclase